MQTSINVLVKIYTPAIFDMGLLIKALEITWAKPLYMQFIFPCGGGMHLLIAGFASIGYLYDTGPRSAVSKVSGYRCESDCRSRGWEFDPGPVPYFREIDHEITSTVILLPSTESFMKGCCQLQEKVCARITG